MAPEQALGKRDLTVAADVFSLGVILYELLTGRPPFRADTPMETVLQVLEKEPEPPRSRNPQIDRDLELICLKCLGKEPDRRYGSAAEFATDLGRWLDGEVISARSINAVQRTIYWIRRRPVLTALVAVSAVAVLALVGASVAV